MNIVKSTEVYLFKCLNCGCYVVVTYDAKEFVLTSADKFQTDFKKTPCVRCPICKKSMNKEKHNSTKVKR